MRRRLFEDGGYPDGLFLLDKDANVLDKTADSYPAGTIAAYGFKAGDGNWYAVDAEAIPNRQYWGGYNKLIESLPEITNATEALQDYNGEQNTTEIITALTGYNDHYATGAPAAEACRAKTFNGKQGFLPAFGQLYDFYKYKTEVESIAIKFSLDVFQVDYYWTSTQYSARESRSLHWRDGSWGVDYRSIQDCVRAFFAL